MLQTHHRGASRAVTTGHNQSQRGTKCPRSPSPSVPRPSQRVTNAHGASAPAPPTSHDGSRLLTGPQPQRISPVTTGHNVPTGPQRVTNAHRAAAPASTTRHNGAQMLTRPQHQRISPVTTAEFGHVNEPQAHSNPPTPLGSQGV